MTLGPRDHICHTIGTHLGNILYGREQKQRREANMDMGAIFWGFKFCVTV